MKRIDYFIFILLLGVVYSCSNDSFTHSIQKVANFRSTYDLVANVDPLSLNNTDKYLTIDQIRTYQMSSSSYQEIEYGGVSVDMSAAPNRIRFQLQEKEWNRNYRIKFSSSKCVDNINHYLYTSFYFEGFGSLLSPDLILIKNRITRNIRCIR